MTRDVNCKSCTEDFSNSPEVQCYTSFFPPPHPKNGSQIHCNVSWDGISCWPPAPAGSLAHLPCFSELNGVLYDSSGNASRQCFENGTWSTWSNYRSCHPINIHEDESQVPWHAKDASTIYYVGYGLSLIALTLALTIFLYFKDLRCLRNTIHTNLIVTYMLIDITWILTASLQSSHDIGAEKAACFLMILFTYEMGTNFFWMFVEGLYLYILVVKTFSIDKVKFKAYLLIGWGIPAIVASVWAGVKGAVGTTSEEPYSPESCPWNTKDYYDYIFICPVVLVLVINIFFLLRIMFVLITKLRASNTAESRQYRWKRIRRCCLSMKTTAKKNKVKAAKALLVLIPLLGVTYILVIATPSDPKAEVVVTYIQVILLSIQGFIVSVLYCFMNGEVQNSLRHHIERWRTQKAVAKGPRHSIVRTASQQGESVCLYSNRAVRDSCTSFTTTTTVTNVHGNSRVIRSSSQNHLAPQDDMV